MVAVKAHQAEAFLNALARIPAAVLFYGPDAGLVSERSATLAKRLAERDGGEIIRLDDADLENDAERIAVELHTVPMFGGRKVVRALAGRRVNANALKGLVETGKLEGWLIVEAGQLRPDEAMRALFEKSAAAAAVACFADETRDLDAVVSSVLGAAKLDITPEAKKLLIGSLGADRALSRAEVEKLALFARGKSVIEETDVEAAVGDAAEMALDRVVLAAASGRTADAVRELNRSIAGGESAQAAIAALQRHFLRLHRLRSSHDGGRSLEEAMQSLRPPLHFKQKAVVEQQCRAWSLPKLTAALASIAETAQAARLNSAMEGTLAEHLLLGLGALAGERKSLGRAKR